MREKSKNVVWLVLAIAIVLSCTIFPGCNGNNKNSTEGLKPATNRMKMYTYSQPDDELTEICNKFENKYGCKVEITVAAMEQLSQKIIAAISSGDSPDWVSLHAGNFPRDPIKNITIPLDPYEEYYGGFDNELWDQNVLEQFSWNGKHYAVSSGGDPIYIFFNKTMFENNGLETPLELYKKGEWNWDTFKKAAMTLTQSSDGGNTTTQWGYGSWQYELFVLSNGGTVVNYNGNQISLNFSDPKTVKALQFMQDGYFKDKYMVPDGNNTWGQLFQNGQLAMTTERAWRASVYIDFTKMKDEWDIAPFPQGPDNTTGINPADNGGYGICNGSKNPEGAALFTKTYYEYYKEKNEKEGSLRPDGKAWSQDTLDMMDRTKKNTVCGRYNGIGNWWNIQTPFWNEIFAGTPVATAIQTYTPTFQREINLMLNYKPITNIEEFTAPQKLDFENGDMGYLTTNLCEKSDTNDIKDVSITTDAAEVINGNASLKLSAGTTEWQRFIRSDETKLKIPPMHAYKVTFDYKVLTDPGVDGLYFVCLRGKEDVVAGLGSYGLTVLDGVYKGDTGSFEAIIPVLDNIENLSLVIGGKNAGELSIDNLQISETNIE